jgi:Lon protease-like protein
MTGDSRPLPMFPLSTVLFPGAPLPLHVFEPRYRRLTTDVLAADGLFGVVLIERGREVGGGDVRAALGTVARVEAASALPDGRWILLARGEHRIEVTAWLDDDPYPRAEVRSRADHAAPEPDALARGEAAVRRARALLSELESAPPLAPAPEDEDPGAAAWRLCAEAPVSVLDRQGLLAQDDPVQRMEALARLAGERALDLELLLSEGRREGPA